MITSRRRRSYFALCMLALLVALTGCDDFVFTTGEMEAKRKYEAITTGASRESVLQKLGAPSFVLSWNATEKRYEYRDASGKSGILDPASESSRASAPAELRLLPKEMTSPAVLVYSAGTVFGYMGLDGSNRVSLVKVRIS